MGAFGRPSCLRLRTPAFQGHIPGLRTGGTTGFCYNYRRPSHGQRGTRGHKNYTRRNTPAPRERDEETGNRG